MVDYEVESTLREIRERVVAESSRAGIAAPHSSDVAASAEASGGVEASGIGAARGGAGGAALARLQANLATTERAWSRLPPVMSYRRGMVARVELWLKRLIKSAAHWFTWEQVNFNSAAHNALSDAHAALAAHERALEELRDVLRRQQSEAESNAARFSELQARLDAFESRLGNTEAHINQTLAQLASDMRQVVAEQRAGVEQLRAERQAGAEQLHAAQREQIQTLAAELRNETRERVEHALEEQRVCFKQLSLEASEAAVAQDRARRQIEARIEALENPVNRKP
jgi:flagellar biosynthesis GTPase FlhF